MILVVPQRVPEQYVKPDGDRAASRTGWAPSASRSSAARGSRAIINDLGLYADSGARPDGGRRSSRCGDDIAHHRPRDDAFRVCVRVEQPGHGDEGHRAARVGCSSTRTCAIARCWPRAPTSSSTRSSRTPGAGWWSTRRSSRTTGGAIPASCRRSSRPTCRDQQHAAADPGAGRVDQPRQGPRCSWSSGSIADMTSPDANPEVSTAIAGSRRQPARPARRSSSSPRRSSALRSMELRLKPEHPDILRMKRLIRDLQKKAETEAMEAPLSPGAPGARPPRRPKRRGRTG